MAISRQQNWTSQIRADVPFLRSIESGICGDFDILAGAALAGKEPLIVSGCHVVTTGITQAQSLILQVADSVLIHFLATASGSIFHVPASEPDQVLSNTNPKLVGGWTASSTNYVSIDFIRAPDASTSDLVEIVDTVSLVETPVTQPLAVLTDYRIHVSTLDFDTGGGCPIARVTLDAGGAIVSIQDARNFMFRLGAGGTIPNPLNTYSWPGGRKEIVSPGDVFSGPDKSIISFKQFNDAVTTRLWELGGGENWFSPTLDHNVRIAQTGTPFVSSGMSFEWVSATNLHWKGLVLIFENSTATFNVIADQTTNVAGLTDLLTGECIFVDVDRTTNRSGGTSLVAQKGTLATLGTPTIPGSRWVLAWNYNGSIYIRDQAYSIGSSFILATISAAGMVQLSETDSTAISPPIVVTYDRGNQGAIAGGLTRGGNDFVGGAGPLYVGGKSLDQGVLIQTTRAQDETIITGVENWAVNFTAPLTAYNSHPFASHPLNLAARFQGFNDNTSEAETAVTIEANGPIGFRNVVVNTSSAIKPNPTAVNPIRNKIYFDTNGLSSPNKRDTMMAIDVNGALVTLLEGTSY